MQRQGMNHQIMRAGFQRQNLVIRHDLGIRERHRAKYLEKA